MAQIFIIQTVCLSCGYVNQCEIGLTHKEDNAVYRCENCKFILFSSWIEDKEV